MSVLLWGIIRMGVSYDKDRFTGKLLRRPSLKLFGGKAKSRDLIFQLFPDPGNIYRYHEPFLGTGGLLLETPVGVKRRGCDINEDVINYYHVLQQSPEEFWVTLQMEMEELFEFGLDAVEYGRECYEGYKDYLNTPGGDHKDYPVQWAVCFYLMTKLGYNGLASRRNKQGKLNCPYCKQIRGRGLFTREWFDQVLEKIEGVEFLEWDFRRSLEGTFPNDFLMVDPPYRETAKKNKRQDYNGKPFTDEDHKDLRDLLKASESKWLVTINDDDFTRDLYKDFNILPHEYMGYSCSQTPEGRGKRPELIVTNYKIPPEKLEIIRITLDDKRVPGKKRSQRVPKDSGLLLDTGEDG